MPELTAFLVPAAVILFLPGPTNTLLAAAGTQGRWKALPLAGAGLAGYMVTVILLVLVSGTLFEIFPQARPILQMSCAAWVAWLGIRMWCLDFTQASGSESSVRYRDVLIATLLNPKGLMFSMSLAPLAVSAPMLGASLAGFAFLIIMAGLFWVSFGGIVSRWDWSRHAGKAASVVMAAFAVRIATSAV